MTERLTEEQLAESVVTYLAGLDWEVYQEVQVHGHGAIADIVARRGPVLWVIECKLSFGLRVLEQAYAWRQHSNMVSVAVPGRRLSRFEEEILKHMGIGMLCVPKGFDWGWSLVDEKVGAVKVRSGHGWPHGCWRNALKESLVEQRKDYAKAGNANGSRWSPYQETCRQVVRYVGKHPGCSFKALLDDVTTHYASKSSARTSLSHWIRAGKVNGVTLKREGRNLLLYPDTTGADRC